MPSAENRAPSTESPPRWHRRPEARREELIEAALQVFGDLGYAQAKLEDVAK